MPNCPHYTGSCLRSLQMLLCAGFSLGTMSCGAEDGSLLLPRILPNGSSDLVARTPIPKRAVQVPVGSERGVRLLVKFVDEAKVRVRTPRLLGSLSGTDLASIEAVVQELDLRFHAPFERATERVERLRAQAELRSGRAQPDIQGLIQVWSPEATPSELAEIGQRLQAERLVEFASLQSLEVPPPVAVDLDPPTDDLVSLQTYRGAEIGIDVDAVGGRWTGAGIRVTDIESCWTLTHEEFSGIEIGVEPGQTPTPPPTKEDFDWYAHGTAVLGILAADNGAFGVSGMAPAAEYHVYPESSEEEGYRRVEAIVNAAADSEAGDILLFEMQVWDAGTGAYGPAELDSSVWMATKMATDAGVIVVAAAGNGAVDLDSEDLEYYRERGDSGAIIVGAGDPETRWPLGYSTFGSRVNVQGWGTNVATTGYGDSGRFGNDENQYYTSVFGGTSSASPIVTAAATLIQQAAKELRGAPLTALQMREVLVGSGTPQAPGPHIGPLPNVRRAVAALQMPDETGPEVRITSPDADLQVEGNSFETSIDVLASDEGGTVRLVSLQVNGEALPNVDEVAPWEFVAVTFPRGVWEVVAVAEDSWGNIAESEPRLIAVGEPLPDAETEGPPDSMGTGLDTVADSTTGDPGPQDSGDASNTDDGFGAGTEPDSAVGSNASDDGCGCRSTGPGPQGLWWLLPAGWFFQRRRSSR